MMWLWFKGKARIRQRLTGINPALYPDFRKYFSVFRTKIVMDSMKLRCLAGTSFGATERCYDVFHYNLKQGIFERRWEDFYCTSH